MLLINETTKKQLDRSSDSVKRRFESIFADIEQLKNKLESDLYRLYDRVINLQKTTIDIKQDLMTNADIMAEAQHQAGITGKENVLEAIAKLVEDSSYQLEDLANSIDTLITCLNMCQTCDSGCETCFSTSNSIDNTECAGCDVACQSCNMLCDDGDGICQACNEAVNDEHETGPDIDCKESPQGDCTTCDRVETQPEEEPAETCISCDKADSQPEEDNPTSEPEAMIIPDNSVSSLETT